MYLSFIPAACRASYPKNFVRFALSAPFTEISIHFQFSRSKVIGWPTYTFSLYTYTTIIWGKLSSNFIPLALSTTVVEICFHFLFSRSKVIGWTLFSLYDPYKGEWSQNVVLFRSYCNSYQDKRPLSDFKVKGQRVTYLYTFFAIYDPY